jgi:hypothetical protein
VESCDERTGVDFKCPVRLRPAGTAFSLSRSDTAIAASLQEELNASTQIMLDCSHKVEWLESRLDDLLDDAQLQSCDVRQEQKRLDQLIRIIKTEAMQRGYRLGVGEPDLR